MNQAFASLTITADTFSLLKTFTDQNSGQTITFQALAAGPERAAVPEVGSAAFLLGTGVTGIMALRRSRKRK